jgi:hypothetical protein
LSNSSGRRLGIFELYLAAFLLLIVALCYKLVAGGLLALAILGTGAWVGRAHLKKINAILILALLYIADATVTAFLVSMSEGALRTFQFILVASGLVGLYSYSWTLDRAQIERALKWIGFLTVAILLHVIVHHMIIGRFTIWKYLADTKMIISMAVFMCFVLRDRVSRYLPFPLAMVILFVLVWASAERKALLLFFAAAASSNFNLKAKAAVVAGGACLLGLVAVSGIDNGFVAREVQDVATSYEDASDRFFMTVENIGDQSDMIREFVNRNAWRLFEENPWVGLGATGYWSWAHEVFGNEDDKGMNVHGEIHRVPVEGGVVGIVIACAYLIGMGWRTAHFAFLRRGRTGASLEHAPFLLFLYVLCYAYAEALDTALLILIGMCGVVAARLPSPSSRDLVGRRVRPASPPLTRAL